MKRTLLAAVLTLGSLSAASTFAQAPAQDAAPMQQQRHHNPHKQAMHIGKKLGLSADQTARIEPILAQRDEQSTAIQQNASLTPEQRKAQLRDLKRNTHQQLAGVLTPDQMQQMKAMHRQHHTRDQQTAPAPNGV